MEITVNGSIKEIKSTLVSELLSELEIKTNGIAFALNNTIIPFKNWNDVTLSEGDKVTIIKATQGG